MLTPWKAWRKNEKNDILGNVTSLAPVDKEDNMCNHHLSQPHRDQIPVKLQTPNLNCNLRSFVAKNGSGLSNHAENKHRHAENNAMKPFQLIPTSHADNAASASTSSDLLTQTEQHQPDLAITSTKWQCPQPGCKRHFRSKAGLMSHTRANNCRFVGD